MSDPFEDPASATPMPYQELNGYLLLFEVLSYEPHVPTVHTPPGEKSPAVRADVTVIDGPQAGNRLSDVLVFPKMLQAQLRPRIGKMVLGRLGQGEARKGQNAPWSLFPATPDDKRRAESALTARQSASIGGAAQAGAAPSAGEPPF